MIAALLALHAVVGVVLLGVGDHLGRRAFLVATLPPVAMLVWLATRWNDVLDGEAVEQSIGWVPNLDLSIDLRVDAFSALMILLVSGIGLAVCTYAWSYFSTSKAGTARLAALVVLFAGAMTGVVVSDHLLALFVFWELTSVTSYLLIGNSDKNPRARAAALQALLITGAGGLSMLFGFVLVGEALGTYRISEIVAGPPVGSQAAIIGGVVCILMGAFTKSAQVPFASWLPGAMVAPTPISAYLHSATMVKAGVYLVARLAEPFSDVDAWRPLVLAVGLTTMVIGGLRALRQTDLKLLLAHGTVSQLGLLMVLFGIGDPAVTQAGVVMLLAHALFKAPLFMVVGIVDHETGTRDIRNLSGFGHGWRAVTVVAVVSAASMAGLPPLLGFIGKEKALETLLKGDVSGSRVALVVMVLGSILTVAYSTRYVLGVTGRLASPEARAAGASREAHAPPAAFTAPAVVLAAATVLIGVAPVIGDGLVEAASIALAPGSSPKHLALWHGWTLPLALSAVIVAVGLAAAWRDPQVQPVLARGERFPSSERGYLTALSGTTLFAKRVTAVVQHGSLPLYASVIVLTLSLVPAVALVLSGEIAGLPALVEAPVEIPLAGLIVVGAFGAAMLRRRFAAALLLGAVGYGMAGIYVLSGATDLALTQFAVETLSIVVFMLTLRHLPDEFARRSPRLIGVVRVVVSVTVALFILLFAVTSPTLRSDAPVSDDYVDRAGPEAKGQNIVNVIIVDFRGLDTLGEIAVIAVTAIGAIGLVRPDRFARRRREGDPSAPTAVEEVVA
jgi:multicomponent Na+:H+ antiporter subunit A